MNKSYLARPGLIVLLGAFLLACGGRNDLLVVRSDKDFKVMAGFDSVLIVPKLEESLLREAGHVLMDIEEARLGFDERNAIERYLEAGGLMTFSCRDTVYNWGQLRPFFQNGQVSIRCDEGQKPKKGVLDYTKVKTPLKPGRDRLVREVLVAPLREPIGIAVTEKSLVYWIERKGTINMYHPGTGQSKEIDRLEVYTGEEDGLLGIVLDPDFQKNHWVYLFYSPPGDIPRQHVSRFFLSPEGLDRASEKVVMVILTQREECCHSAGDLEFDQKGNLYISTGDNTFSRASDGFTPLDERPGRSAFDAQKSSSNTHDLRGKILRIHPERDGTYTIPDGNLFPKDGSAGLPEIYAMGARNPFTIAIHPDKGWLYWGDVGPDGNVTSERGPTAHDEVNFAKSPGNYGWPYFNANNLAYADYDFATGQLGERFDPLNPKNTSVNNTGNTRLPPAVPAMVYYTFDETAAFPGVGKGSRSVGVGEVYDYGRAARHGYQFPEYYHHKLFVFDWARDWIMVVTQDRDGHFLSIEPFLDNAVLASPIDMTFGPDGALYVLEYGIGYFTDNRDSKLIKIDFINGNRPPVAQISASRSDGPLPLEMELAADQSYDPDGETDLNYTWKVTGPETLELEGAQAHLALTQPGEYLVEVYVGDGQGATGKDQISLLVGNTAPQIEIDIHGNQTFYTPGSPVAYEVKVRDAEDGTLGNGISGEQVAVSLARYHGSDNRAAASLAMLGQVDGASLPVGLQLIQKSDCKSCHKINEPSIGPSFYDIAERYDQDYIAIELLSRKIINGGSGVWGDGMMIGHPDFSDKAAQEIVKYIFSVNDQPTGEGEVLPLKGVVATSQDNPPHLRIAVSYTDRGGTGVRPVTTTEEKTLVPPTLQAELADELSGFRIQGAIEDGDARYVEMKGEGAYLLFSEIDLTNISSIECFGFVKPSGVSGLVELRSGAVDGPLLGQGTLSATGASSSLVSLDFNASGKHNLYITFKIINSDYQLGVGHVYFHLNPKLP